jgi:hypothetical protein
MQSLRTISFVCMSLGVILFLTGILFKIQHWPDMLKGKISGIIAVCLGVVLFIMSIKKSKE